MLNAVKIILWYTFLYKMQIFIQNNLSKKIIPWLFDWIRSDSLVDYVTRYVGIAYDLR